MGTNGRLAPKKKPDGRPLGVGQNNDLRILILRGRILVRRDGFTEVHTANEIDGFHKGSSPGQVPRPIIGLTPKQSREYAAEVARELGRQAKKLGLR